MGHLQFYRSPGGWALAYPGAILNSSPFYSLINKNPQKCWKATIPGAGHFPSFFVCTPGHLDSLCPHPGEFAHFKKKNANARGLARGGGAWAPLELTDALFLQKNYSLRRSQHEMKRTREI